MGGRFELSTKNGSDSSLEGPRIMLLTCPQANIVPLDPITHRAVTHAREVIE